jgi:hypothetical protein
LRVARLSADVAASQHASRCACSRPCRKSPPGRPVKKARPTPVQGTPAQKILAMRRANRTSAMRTLTCMLAALFPHKQFSHSKKTNWTLEDGLKEHLRDLGLMDADLSLEWGLPSVPGGNDFGVGTFAFVAGTLPSVNSPSCAGRTRLRSVLYRAHLCSVTRRVARTACCSAASVHTSELLSSAQQSVRARTVARACMDHLLV